MDLERELLSCKFGVNNILFGLKIEIHWRKEMNCPRCRAKDIHIKMKPVKKKGGFHKNTKFICPNCNYTRMKTNKRKD